MTDLIPFLQWLVYAGGSILVGSWILERIPTFVAAPPEAKKSIAIVVDVVLSLGFYAILVFVPKDILAQLAPWFTVAAGTVILYSGGQVYHQVTKS